MGDRRLETVGMGVSRVRVDMSRVCRQFTTARQQAAGACSSSMRTRLSSSSRRFSTTSSSSRVDRTPMSRCWRASAMWCCSGRSASSSRVFTVTASLAKATASSTRLLAFSFACFASDEANVETSTVHAGGSFSSPKAMARAQTAQKTLKGGRRGRTERCPREAVWTATCVNPCPRGSPPCCKRCATDSARLEGDHI